MTLVQPYLYEGIVLPERAHLSLQLKVDFQHLISGISASAHISIILNKVAVWIYTDTEWNIFDLRNVARSIVQNEIDLIGYIKGYAYEMEISRVLHSELGIDYVFGIDVPCIADRNISIDLEARIALIRRKISGAEGILLHRCFNDLAAAMKHPDDTGFYCYRAIESLRNHCALRFNLSSKNKDVQWNKLREVTQFEKSDFLFLKKSADPLRHGDVMTMTSEEREKLFLKTWDIVDKYIENS